MTEVERFYVVMPCNGGYSWERGWMHGPIRPTIEAAWISAQAHLLSCPIASPQSLGPNAALPPGRFGFGSF